VISNSGSDRFRTSVEGSCIASGKRHLSSLERRDREVGLRRFWLLFSFAACAFFLGSNRSAAAQSYEYDTQVRGDVEADFQGFRQLAEETLADSRGWTLNLNVEFTEVSSGEDFRLILASPDEVDRAAPGCSEQRSCRVGDDVLINDRRWRHTTPTWPLSRRAYRHYVINHEVGHWLGLGHFGCPGTGEDAPVMMQ
jgi:hypothetical protein